MCFLVTMVFCSHKLSDHPQKGLICDDVCWPSILTNPLNFQVQGRLCKIQAFSWVSLLSRQKIIRYQIFYHRVMDRMLENDLNFSPHLLRPNVCVIRPPSILMIVSFPRTSKLVANINETIILC